MATKERTDLVNRPSPSELLLLNAPILNNAVNPASRWYDHIPEHAVGWSDPERVSDRQLRESLSASGEYLPRELVQMVAAVHGVSGGEYATRGRA